MNTTMAGAPSVTSIDRSPLARRVLIVIGVFKRIPNSLIALVARFSIAAVFWNSGQTKVEGLAINLVNGEFKLA